MKLTETTPGAPCWVELGTHNVPKAAEFYAGLFGWVAETDERPEAGGYTMCTLGGQPVAAMSPMYAPNQPVAWSVSFATPDADTTADAATNQGAAVLMPPMDVLDAGRFAVLQDPTGAVFSIWQPRTFHGFALFDEPGSACWAELATREVGRAQEFYRAVFDWTIGEGEYPHLSAQGREFGGIQDMNTSHLPKDDPPHWLVYFKTEDVGVAAAKATGMGAETLAEPMEVPGTGRLAVLRDPEGAAFALYQAQAIEK